MERLSWKKELAAAPAILVLMVAAVVNSGAQTTPRASMELLETKTSQTQSTIDVVGQVKNISTRPVEGVAVNCDFLDAGGRSLKREKGTLATDPLAPAKISQFKCSTASNAAVKGFKVTFGQMFGGPLVTKDSRK